MSNIQCVELRKRSDSERKAYIEGALASFRMFEDVVERYCEMTGSNEIDTLRSFAKCLGDDYESLVAYGDR